MEWIGEVLRIVRDVIGATKEWGGRDTASVPWADIYRERRKRDKALADKHKGGDDTGDSSG